MKSGPRCRALMDGSSEVQGGEGRESRGRTQCAVRGRMCVTSAGVRATTAGWLGFRSNVSAHLKTRVTTARSSRPVQRRKGPACWLPSLQQSHACTTSHHAVYHLTL